ncbi:MAG: hypothetical protein AB7D57_09850 [Desulfovibrionaceae bacterium]
MPATVDDITVNYEENGVLIVKELDKRVLSKGAWATLLFKYQEFSRAKQQYGPEKYAIRRYQKVDGEYRSKSKFVISSADQARQIIDTLTEWTAAE